MTAPCSFLDLDSAEGVESVVRIMGKMNKGTGSEAIQIEASTAATHDPMLCRSRNLGARRLLNQRTTATQAHPPEAALIDSEATTIQSLFSSGSSAFIANANTVETMRETSENITSRLRWGRSLAAASR